MTRVTPELALPSPNFWTTPAGGRLTPVRFKVHQATNTVDLQWNRVSSLEPSDTEAETLPQGSQKNEVNLREVSVS
ncbi:hypothetical protein AVEN_118327-1 [Araneus ventricosus]|uniref:Uncharacterized protein n=1 Tax=Araneus ventricosus TaxID=182803 RepID=A0A4Y2B8K8_ARAVE|nr:hypothetical protein AVEN_118327-1 [Araneus ventricosus]